MLFHSLICLPFSGSDLDATSAVRAWSTFQKFDQLAKRAEAWLWSYVRTEFWCWCWRDADEPRQPNAHPSRAPRAQYTLKDVTDYVHILTHRSVRSAQMDRYRIRLQWSPFVMDPNHSSLFHEAFLSLATHLHTLVRISRTIAA